ncbi:MAG: DUF6482 family protein [Pseudomonadota bacterium]
MTDDNKQSTGYGAVKSIRLNSLKQQPHIDKVEILSITPSLYTMRVFIGNSEYLVLDHGASIRRGNAEALKQLLLGCNVDEYRLVHQSAYDEMVGQPGDGINRLSVRTSPPKGPLD